VVKRFAFPISAMTAITAIPTPARPFLILVANKALPQFDPWATLRDALGGPWTTLGHPNPIPSRQRAALSNAPLAASGSALSAYSLGSTNAEVVFMGSVTITFISCCWNGSTWISQDLTTLAP
jgi:hypothetical protein